MVVKYPGRSEYWTDDQMKNVSLASYYLFLLVNSVLKYNELYEKMKPLRK